MNVGVFASPKRAKKHLRASGPSGRLPLL